MSSPERRSTTEMVTSFSKKVDIGGIVVGLVIGGEFGSALAIVSGLTYILADQIEKGQKKS